MRGDICLLLLMAALAAVPAAAQSAPSAPWPRERPASFVDLAFPPEAVSARVVGKAVVRVTADAGRVTGAETLAGPHAKMWKMHPGGSRRGVFVYEFTLDNPHSPRKGQLAFIWVTEDYRRLGACSPLVQVSTGGPGLERR